MWDPKKRLFIAGSYAPPGIGVRALLLACFFLSGASGLIYEVVWMRRLVLIFGLTAFATSTVLTAFMAGLTVGSFLFGRFIDRFRRPLLVYGLLELGVGLYALALPSVFDSLIPLYRLVWRTFHLSFYPFSLLRFLLALLALLIPTTLMGGTLPTLGRFFARREEKVGLHIGLLYGLNTFGAVLGTAAAGFLLLPELGMRGATTVAVTLNIAVGVFALALASGEQEGLRQEVEGRQPQAPSSPHLPRPAVLGALFVLGASGFAAMTYEVAWTRLLTLILGSSTYAFTIMLTTFLGGLALGTLLMARFVDRLARPLSALALCQIGIGLAALLGEHLFGQLPSLFLLLFQWLSSSQGLLFFGQFLLAALVMFLPTLLMGAVFPLVIRIYTENIGKVGRFVGNAYAINTLGTILGASLSGFLLLPAFGIQATVGLAITLNLGLGFLLILLQERRGRLQLATGGMAVLLFSFSLLFAPSWDALAMSSGVYKDAPLYLRLSRSPWEALSKMTSQYHQLFYKEGVTTTVTVVERPSLAPLPHLTLAIDGKVEASTAADMATQILSAHLPLLLHERPEKVMVIGLASGMTVGSVLQHPVEEITVVEIEPAVIEASHLFDAFNHRPLQDPRVKLIVDDARNHILVDNEKFDVIISEPSNPWMSGPSKLFTREFFELGKDRLKKGGIFVQWLQLYGMEPPHLKALVRTFRSIFPHLLIFQTAEGDLLLLGSGRPLVIDSQRLARRMSAPKVAADLTRVGVRSPVDLLVRFRLGSEEIEAYVGKGPLNTDGNGLIEFAAPKSLYLETGAANLEEIRKASLGIAGYLRNPGSEEEKEAFSLKLAKRHLALGGLEEAERLTLEGQPLAGTAGGHWVLGEIHLKQGNEPLAVESWRKALAEDPSHLEALMSLALFSYHRGRPREAEPYWERLLKGHPSNPLILFYHGLNRYLLGDSAGAASKLTSALQAGLENAEAMDEYYRLRGLGEAPLARYYLSLAYGRLNRPALASSYRKRFLKDLEIWREDLEQKPTDLSSVSPLLLFRFHLNLGIHIPGEVKLAKLIHQRVGEPLVHYYKGTTLLFLGSPQEAVSELEAAIKALPEPSAHTLAHYYLGLAYREVGALSRALTHFERFLEGLGDQSDQPYRRADAVRNIKEISLTLGQADEA